jgi:hypothetical protein
MEVMEAILPLHLQTCHQHRLPLLYNRQPLPFRVDSIPMLVPVIRHSLLVATVSTALMDFIPVLPMSIFSASTEMSLSVDQEVQSLHHHRREIHRRHRRVGTIVAIRRLLPIHMLEEPPPRLDHVI